MNHFDDNFSLLGALAEFDEVRDAGDDAQIEAPFIPLRDLVLFPHMVTPLFIVLIGPAILRTVDALRTM